MNEPTTTLPRPRQVTVAAWLIMVGSVFVVLMVWDRIAGLHSLDSRESLKSVLDSPGINGSGLQVADLMVLVKTVSMVAAGCATAMAILGYQALQRSRSARLVLTVLAIPLFLSGLVTGGIVSSGVAAAVATLWLGPARDWFDGKAASQSERSMPAPEWPPPLQHPPPDQSPPSSGPDPGAAWTPPPTSAYGVRPAAATGSRPAPLLWACLLTWVFSGLAALVLVASIVVLVGDPRLVLDTIHRQNPDLASQDVSDHFVLVVGYVTCALFILWSVASAAFAVLAFRRRRLGWTALLASTSGVAVVCLLGSLGSLVFVVPLLAAIAGISLLVRPEVKAWFA